MPGDAVEAGQALVATAPAGRPRLVYFHARNSGRSRRVEGVVEGKRIRGRLAGPRGCRDIERLLAPWLR